MISICLLMQLKAQLLSLHLPHKYAQTAKIQVANLTGRLLYALVSSSIRSLLSLVEWLGVFISFWPHEIHIIPCSKYCKPFCSSDVLFICSWLQKKHCWKDELHINFDSVMWKCFVRLDCEAGLGVFEDQVWSRLDFHDALNLTAL